MESKSLIFPRIKNLSCCYEGRGPCVCGNEEVVIRNYIDGGVSDLMSPEQREWCISQADWAGEGHYNREELSLMPDKELASAVMNAWGMYAQSQY